MDFQCGGWRWRAGGVAVAMLGIALFAPATAWAQAGASDPLADPVVYGAWLYEGNCVRCHGDYRERVGKRLDADELQDAIAGEGRDTCQVQWGRKRGGPLSVNEIKALVAYMTAWEEAGAAPELLALPPQPTPTPTATATAQAAGVEALAPAATATPTPDPELAAIQQVIADDPVAHGAVLYTQTCYRCHREYAFGRMATAMDTETLTDRIKNGKAGTGMLALGFVRGGPLKTREINSIVEYVTAFERAGAEPALPPLVEQYVSHAEAAAIAAGLPPPPVVNGIVVSAAVLPAVTVPQGSADWAGSAAVGLALLVSLLILKHL